MKKIVTLCLVAALSASIIGGCAQEKDNENTEKVEAQEKVGKYTMPDEKASMKAHGCNGHMITHMDRSIKKK